MNTTVKFAFQRCIYIMLDSYVFHFDYCNPRNTTMLKHHLERLIPRNRPQRFCFKSLVLLLSFFLPNRYVTVDIDRPTLIVRRWGGISSDTKSHAQTYITAYDRQATFSLRLPKSLTVGRPRVTAENSIAYCD